MSQFKNGNVVFVIRFLIELTKLAGSWRNTNLLRYGKVQKYNGLCAGMRIVSGKFKDVQSSINWVSIGGGTL